MQQSTPRGKSPGPAPPQTKPKKLIKPNPAHRSFQPATFDSDKFVDLSPRVDTPLAKQDRGSRRRSKSDCLHQPASVSESAPFVHDTSRSAPALPASPHISPRANDLPASPCKPSRFHEHFSERGSDASSVSTRYARPRSHSAASVLPVPPPARPKFGKQGSAFVEVMSNVAPSVRSEASRSSPHNKERRLILTPLASTPSRLASQPLFRVSKPPKSPLASKHASPPTSPTQGHDCKRLRYADVKSDPLGPAPSPELLGVSTAQWRHSSSPPPEGYEYVPPDEQGTAEDFMEGFLLNPNTIRPIKEAGERGRDQ